MTVCVSFCLCAQGVQGSAESEQPGFWVSLVGQLPSDSSSGGTLGQLGFWPPSGSSSTKSAHSVNAHVPGPTVAVAADTQMGPFPQRQGEHRPGWCPRSSMGSGRRPGWLGVMGSSLQQREGPHTWAWRPGAPALLPESLTD